MLTVKDVQEKLSVSVITALRMINEGHIRAINVARCGSPKWRIREEDFEAFLQERTNQKQPVG